VTTPVLWLNGPSGVGKTTVGREIVAALGRSGTPSALIDTDMLGLVRPSNPADPEHHRLKAAHLGALWPVYRAAGARCLVLAGEFEDAAYPKLYADRIPDATVTVCRLRLDETDHRSRILERNGKSVAWADRLVADGAQFERTDFADIVVDTGGLDPAASASRILAAAGGWPLS